MTTTKTAPRRSIEEKKAQAAALHESIATQVEALRDSERWTAFLAFAFHAYSLNNVLLILGQRPDASRVAGFRKWQGLGRQVRKGEKAVRIFGYSTKKVTEEDENGDEVEKRIARFPSFIATPFRSYRGVVTITSALLGFAAVAAILTVIPGLDTTLVLRSALTQSRRHAAVTTLGVSVGELAGGAAAAVGAAALLAASALAYRALTIVGAAYMAYLGVMLIVRSFRHEPAALDQGAAPMPLWRSFLTGAWTNLLNPKIGAFYVATIPQFIPEGSSHLGMGLLLAGVHDVIGLLWFAGIIWGAQAARRWLGNARALKIIDRIAGVVLIGFGARLVLERH